MLSQLPARDEFARTREQHMQDLKRFLLQLHSQPAPPQLAILHIQVEDAEAESYIAA